MSMRVRQISKFVYIYIKKEEKKRAGFALSVQAIDTHLPPYTAFERSYLMTGFYCCLVGKVCKYMHLSVVDRRNFAKTIFTNQKQKHCYLKS